MFKTMYEQTIVSEQVSYLQVKKTKHLKNNMLLSHLQNNTMQQRCANQKYLMSPIDLGN